jgi:hypothetical protein
MYVLSNICANPPNAVTIPSSIWKVAAVPLLNLLVKLLGSLGIPPMPPYMPPYIPPP